MINSVIPIEQRRSRNGRELIEYHEVLGRETRFLTQGKHGGAYRSQNWRLYYYFDGLWQNMRDAWAGSLEKLFQKVFNTRRLRQPRLISDNENVVAPVRGYNHSICTLDDLVGIRIALRAEPWTCTVKNLVRTWSRRSDSIFYHFSIYRVSILDVAVYLDFRSFVDDHSFVDGIT